MDTNTIQEGATTLDALASFDFELPTEEQKPKEEKKEAADIDFTAPVVEPAPAKEVVEKPKEKEFNFEDRPNDFSDLARTLIESGDWQDVEILGEDDTKSLLSEIKNLTKEQYLELLAKQKDFKDEEQKDKFINVEGSDETKRRLINIIKEGGDLSEIFQNQSQIQRPFEGADLDDENTLANIVYRQHLANGLDEKEAVELTKLAQKEFTIDEKAKKIVAFHQKNYDDHLINVEKKLQEDKLAETEKIKSYRTNLSKKYKEQGVPDAQVKRYVDLATRENKDGIYEVDAMFEEAMKDPEKASEIIQFLADKEKYLESKALDSKKKQSLNVFKTMSFTSTDKPKKIATTTEEKGEVFSFD